MYLDVAKGLLDAATGERPLLRKQAYQRIELRQLRSPPSFQKMMPKPSTFLVSQLNKLSLEKIFRKR